MQKMPGLGVKARYLKKIKAQISVYSPWLICKFRNHKFGMIFPYVGPWISINQYHLWYRYETCTLIRFEFMAKIGLKNALNFILSVMISQTCPDRGYLNVSPVERYLVFVIWYHHRSNPSICWLKPINLGINPNKLFLIILFHLIWSWFSICKTWSCISSDFWVPSDISHI